MYTMQMHDDNLTEAEILQEILILEMEMTLSSEY